MPNIPKVKHISNYIIAQCEGWGCRISDICKRMEEELNEKVNTRLEAMNAKYSVFGRVAEESLEVLPLITTSDMIESVDIEVRG